VVVGRFVAERVPTVLVQRRQTPEISWQRLQHGERVWTTDRLVSLPGYASEVRLDSGVHLLLRGHIPEFSTSPMMNYLLDSAVVLHPGKDVDADVTLQWGRLYLSSHKDKGPAKVRLRFDKEVWDLTLEEPDTEVGVDLLRLYTPDINYLDGEDPRAELYLCMLRGKASLRVDGYHFSNLQAPPGPALFVWDNKGSGWRGPLPLERPLPEFDKQPPATKAKEMMPALEGLSKRMVGKRKPDVVLLEGLQKEQPTDRLLCIYALCALDEVVKLVETVGDEDADPTHALDRGAAIFTLQRWLSRGPGQGPRLYNPKTRTGLLLDSLKYRSKDAEKIFVLLHDLPPKDPNRPEALDRDSPETFELLADYLCSKQVAIAELAWYHLRVLARGVPLPGFNAAFPLADREKASAQIKKLIAEGKLPPPPPAAPPGSGTRPKPKP
jgi:hypothetical protein